MKNTRIIMGMSGLLLCCLGGISNAEEQNLVRNGGFEEAALSGWEILNKDMGACAPDPTVKHSGNASLKLTPGPEAAAAGAENYLTLRQIFAATGGGDYKVEAFVRVGAEYTGAPLKLFLAYKSAGKPVRIALPFKGRPDEWVKMTEVFSLPENATDLAIQFVVSGKGGNVWLDDVLVTKTRVEYSPIE